MLPTMPHAGRFKDLKRHERVTASWFAMTGVVHFIIEGELGDALRMPALQLHLVRLLTGV